MTIVNTTAAMGKGEEAEKLDDACNRLPELVPAKRVIGLIRELQEKGIKMCAVTASRRRYAESVLAYYGLEWLECVCSEDVEAENRNPKTLSSEDDELKERRLEVMDMALEKLDYDVDADGEIYMVGADYQRDVIVANSYEKYPVKSIWAIWFSGKKEDWDKENPPYLICREENALVAYFRNACEEIGSKALLRKRTDSIYQLYDYFPTGKGKLHDAFSEKLRKEIKEGKSDDFKECRDLVRAIQSLPIDFTKTALFVAPSSKKDKWNEVLVEHVVAPLAVENGCINAVSYLRRTEDVDSAHLSEETRSAAKQKATLSLDVAIQSEGIENIIVLDDFVTSGSTFLACIDMLQSKLSIAGEHIYCISVAGTVSSNRKEAEKEFVNGRYYVWEAKVSLGNQPGAGDCLAKENLQGTYDRLTKEYIPESTDARYAFYRSELEYDKQPKGLSKAKADPQVYRVSGIGMREIPAESRFDEYCLIGDGIFDTFLEAKAAYEDAKQGEKYQLLVRSDAGKLTIAYEKYSVLQRNVGAIQCVISEKKESLAIQRRDNFLAGRGLLTDSELENASKSGLTNELRENITLIPTLFKILSINQERQDFHASLERVYDSNVVKWLKHGCVLNALLPYAGDDNENIAYSYQGKEDITFMLPGRPADRMLYLTLESIQEGDVEIANAFGYARFLLSDKMASKGNGKMMDEVRKEELSNAKGTLSLNMSLKEYNDLQELGNANKFKVYDEQMGVTLGFDCRIELLPCPGRSGGTFVYLDGSSQKSGREEEVYGAGYILSQDKRVFLGCCTGAHVQANFKAEIEAATNVFAYYSQAAEPAEEINIYFDNTSVGYLPAGLYGEHNDTSKVYMEVLQKKFQKSYGSTKLNFIHVDGHSNVYGNEMADRLAQVNEEKLLEEKEFPSDFAEVRERLCPKDGSFSEGFLLG